MSRAAALTVVAFLVVCGGVSGFEDFREVLKNQFRVRCDYSHTLRDDPILKPRRPGASHPHDFFGFKSTNAYTTNASSMVGKATTCTIKDDSAAYWIPSLYQRRPNRTNGVWQYDQVKPDWVLFYYRIAVNNPRVVRTIPQGLKMVTGNPMAGLHQSSGGVNVEWWCGTYGKHFNNFPEQSCAPGVALIGKLNYPSCWNGRDLESPDGKSHMTHIPLNTRCPASHPIAIPRISCKFYYPVRPGMFLGWPAAGHRANPPPAVYLATKFSGGMGTGHEFHADFMNGWKAATLQNLVTRCISNATDGCGVQGDDSRRNPHRDGPGCGPDRKQRCTGNEIARER